MKKERIAYKVVTSKFESVSMNSPRYKKKYLIGETIKAEPNTFGIFCFDYIRDAKSFMGSKEKLLKVRPIGRGIKITIRSSIRSSRQITNFYKEYWEIFGRMFGGIKFKEKLNLNSEFQNKNNTFYVPHGTICYPSVEVLEEIKALRWI